MADIRWVEFYIFSSFRRPNPIPILAPPDHKKNANQSSSALADDSDKNTENDKATSSAENIDHILDNMFTQRQPYEPTISLKDSQAASATASDDKSDEQLNDGMNVRVELFLKDWSWFMSFDFISRPWLSVTIKQMRSEFITWSPVKIIFYFEVFIKRLFYSLTTFLS